MISGFLDHKSDIKSKCKSDFKKLVVPAFWLLTIFSALPFFALGVRHQNTQLKLYSQKNG